MKNSITFDKLKNYIFESNENNKFKVGYRYNWWSRNSGYTNRPYVVVDISPDRSSLMEIPLYRDYDDGGAYKYREPAAYKYSIITDEFGNEKISDHPAAYVWRVSRADKGGEYFGVPKGWYSQESANRKEGAEKASKTRHINSTLKKIANNITKEQFFKLFAEIFQHYNSWKDVEEMFKRNNIEGEMLSGQHISKGRAPKTSKTKPLSYIFIGFHKGGHPIQLGYDGEKFFVDWDDYDSAVPDEKIKEILGDII